MKEKNNNEESLFNEEVAEEELHSKLGVDDHIYITRKHGLYGGPLLILLAIFLAFSALFAIFYGMASLNNDLNGRDIGVYVDEYHLKVIHSNDLYGGNIKSFSKYRTSNNFYSYKFSVVNNNDISLDYSIALDVNEKDSNLDIGLIKYSLLRNGISVKSGNLSSTSNKLYSATALKNSADEYQIRLWSSDLDKDLNFKFRMKINV